ncbi:TIGR04283 family arsenosugar biosynthesis glycosyltransferase [Bizionia hallyeonensis]|uniref:TIGR04283 family arsenosugar biosynthesis glycosyltransferase n=1 Tax=Bizionia hallyeonensis TaxID=1123757 RepID=A0ABW0C0R5_9FLAO
MINSISIIIPMLNEAESIASVLEHLLENSTSKNIAEIIVVDGGSVDGSQNIVNKFVPSNKIQLLNAHKGRAKQMNFGANHATGTILYFLHADSFPPKNFDNLIIQEVTKRNLAGCFRLQFDNNHWWLQVAGWLTQFSWRASRGGDQSQFITKQLFTEIGGFDENFTIYEDNILINELYARKQFVVIQDKIKTSARLYDKHGVWTLQYHFWTIYIKKWFGASADELYTYYQKYIS